MRRVFVVCALVGALVVAVGAPSGAATTPSTSDAAGMEALQRELNALGCNAGTIDGKLGPNTIQAIRWFQAASGITVDGIVGAITSAKLAQAAASGGPTCPSVPAPAPATSTAAAACTEAAIRAGAQAALLANERMVKSGPYQCVDGLAYNAPTISASGGKPTQVIELLQWNGATWKAVNRSLYCESGSVPKLIYARTCLTGNTPANTNPGTSDAAAVQRMQRELNALGCNAGTADGKLGPKTTAAVRWFQAAAKLPVDGIVGPLTGPALTQASATGSPSCTQVPAPPAPAKTKGGPDCTQAAIQAAAQKSLNAGERIVLSGPFQCGGIWASNGPTIATAAGTRTQVNELMRWNGTAWQVVDRGAYCESGGIPAVVAQKACQV
ncbi:MAG: peptidoglycan-binding domain-containing protein [Acidimicrobiia bacterium]|jgi:peptidoglycan hydrolase-like protein with peptidoglycan-binding domain